MVAPLDDAESAWPAIVLMRHGQTEWNLIGRRQGQLDSALTRAGVGHATNLAKVIRGVGVDRVFTSPLGRARHTASIVAASLQLEVEVVDDLAEVHHGDMPGLKDEEIVEHFAAHWSKRAHDKYWWRFPGGESYADAELRALTALRLIAASRAKLPLVVTHEMLGRMLRHHLLGITVAEALTLDHPQSTAYLIQNGQSRELPAR